MQRHLLAIAGILTVAAGCDNVAWGGAELELLPPRTMAPDSVTEPPEGEVADDAPEPESEALGALLLAGTREGAAATFVVVGEVDGDALLPPDGTPAWAERARRLAAAPSRWVLFSEGVRVGSFTATAATQATEFCPSRPALTGTIELVPTATAAARFLALPAGGAERRDYAPFQVHEDVYDQRVATLAWAGDAIPRFGAVWPPDGLVPARRDIRAFQLAAATGPSVAATFLFRDRLAVGPAEAGGYALFVLGARADGAYREEFAWYRGADAEGKGAPRFFDHLDWDGDGDAEILVDVFGSDRRWFAALGRRDGQWVRTHQDVCATSGPGA